MGTCGVEEMRMAAAMAAFGSQCHPRKRPTVGAGSSQREDSPAHLFTICEDSPARPHHARTPCPRGDTIDGYGGGGARMRIWVRGRL